MNGKLNLLDYIGCLVVVLFVRNFGCSIFVLKVALL